MSFIRHHKPVFAAVLLALYVFITMPVQLWHHHSINAGTPDRPGSTSSIQLKQEAGKKIESNCEICSHHYAASLDDASRIVIMASIAHHTKLYWPIQSLPFLLLLKSANKGPPVL